MKNPIPSLLLVLAALAAGPSSATESTPAAATAVAPDTAPAVVEHLHATLLEAMQGGAGLGFAGRRELIAPVLAASFDFESISRIVCGRHWVSLDEAARAAFVKVFSDLSTATYAANFAAFDGQRFVTLASEAAGDDALVRTELTSPDGDRVSLVYRLQQRAGGWRIINVIAQGVSDLALKRAEYAAVIKNEGFAALVAHLERKIAELGTAS